MNKDPNPSEVLSKGGEMASGAGLPAHASGEAATDTLSVLEDAIEAALQDSLGPDWTCRDGAKAVIAGLAAMNDAERVPWFDEPSSEWVCTSCGAPFQSADGKIVDGTCPHGRDPCPLVPA